MKNILVGLLIVLTLPIVVPLLMLYEIGECFLNPSDAT